MIEIPSKIMLDFNIEQKAEQLLKLAVKENPCNQWFILATFWSDGDYKLSIQSSFGGKILRYTYQKSENFVLKETTMPLQTFFEEVLSTEKIMLESKTVGE